MAQLGFQTQLLYGSLVPGLVPLASTLTTNTSGVEVAVNAADGKLYFKDVNGQVRVLADMNLVGAAGVASISGGTINGASIGATTPASGNFTTLTSTSMAVPSLVGIVKSAGNAGFVAASPMTDYLPGSALGIANGAASLDSSGKVPVAQLPDSSTGGVIYLGTWNAATNTPTIVSGVGTKGYFYKVATAGSTIVDGVSSWAIGDQIIFSGTVWQRVAETSAPVQSVNSKVGAVVLTRVDLGAASSGANTDITSLAGLTTALSVAQGGTGKTTLTGIIKGNGNSPFNAAVAGTDYAPATSATTAQLLGGNGGGGFSNISLGSGLALNAGVLTATAAGGVGTVTSIDVNGGTTGLTFSGGPVTTSGALTLSGTLSVANGGTGKATLAGLLKGNGTSAITSAIVGTDYAPATNGSAAQLLANSGSGGFTNVTLGAGLLYSGGTLSAPGTGSSTGTVTSVDVSGGTTGLTITGGPITTNGVLTLGGKLAVASGGTGAAAISGLVRGNGTAAFSAAVPAVDYAIPTTGTSIQLLANNGSGGFSNVVVGSGLSYTGGVLTASSSATGTVTSVAASGGTTGLTFTGSPITTSGTMTLGGTLGVANGGTGVATLSGLLKGNGTSAITSAIAGTDYAPVTTATTAQLLAGNGVGGFSNVVVGTGLALTGGTLSSTVTATIPDGSITDIKIASNAGIQASKLSYTATGVSAVPRTLASRFGDFLFVKDFGAVGDGAANDSIAVAAAIAAAVAANKTLVFSDGVYSIPALSTLQGRVILVGLGNVTLKGTVQYTNTYAESADTLTPLTSSSSYFSATGINFQSTTTDYGLRLRTVEQGRVLSTFAISNCRFYGSKGLLAQNMIGFSVNGCEFNNTVAGTQLEGCADGLITQCRWQNQAEVGLRLTNTTDHGVGGFDKAGGKNIRIAASEFLYCTVGLHADKANNTAVTSTLMDFCATPIQLTGASYTKLGQVTARASNAPVTRFSAVSGYVAPPAQGVALYGRPGGYLGGDLSVGVTANSCEFSNSTGGTNTAVVWVDGYYNATYPGAAERISFYDCLIAQEASHAAPTLLYVSRATRVRVASNRFQSPNLSTTLVDSWRAENCTAYMGVLNDFTRCTQSSLTVGSSYERSLTTTFIQATEPTQNVQPGDIWVQP